jgi:hypothetical protein
MSGRPILANGLKVKPKKFRSECVAHDKDCSLRGDARPHLCIEVAKMTYNREHKALGLCTRCNRPVEPNTTKCKHHHAKNAEYCRAFYKREAKERVEFRARMKERSNESQTPNKALEEARP